MKGLLLFFGLTIAFTSIYESSEVPEYKVVCAKKCVKVKVLK